MDWLPILNSSREPFSILDYYLRYHRVVCFIPKLCKMRAAGQVQETPQSGNPFHTRATKHSSFLPSANEVWGKVMFSHMSVILFTEGVGMMSLPVWLPDCLIPCSFWEGSPSGGGGYPSRGVSPSREVWYYPPLVLSFSGSHQNGRYASYWNAYLFLHCSRSTYFIQWYWLRKTISDTFIIW